MSEEDLIVVTCEKVDTKDGVIRFKCKYDGGEFDVDVKDVKDKIELSIPKTLAEKYEVKEIVKMMLEPDTD
ncbi:MAG: hypothetical protein L3J47_11565 [Sulfurovum sp.]|nr:hypothetical protein [Sulfurovum sp.]